MTLHIAEDCKFPEDKVFSVLLTLSLQVNLVPDVEVLSTEKISELVKFLYKMQ